jgi:hypothetical protein
VRLAEIIHEIDEYLLRLQQARDLLATTTTAERRSPARSRQPTIIARKRVRATTRNARPLAEKKLPAKVTTRRPKPAAENDSGSHIGISVTAEVKAAERNEPSLSAPERVPRKVEGAPSPQRKGAQFTPQSRRTVRREKAPAKLETAPKPTTAFGKPVSTGWIVVSAEEAKRQREPQAHLARARPTSPTRGLTGRRAFEALFGDPSESSGISPNLKR